MAQDRFVLTRAGYDKLKEEMDELQGRLKGEIDNYGDVHYSAFDPSPEEAAFVETKTTKEDTEQRIDHLKFVLDRAEVIEEDPDTTRVDPGERVTVWDLEAEEERQF